MDTSEFINFLIFIKI